MSHDTTTVKWPWPTFGRVAPLFVKLKDARALGSYLHILSGTAARLILQTIYFLALANALPLKDMGVFAAVSAAGMMIGSFTAFGFQAYVFRSAASRPAALKGALGAYYAAFVVSLPLGLLAAGLVERVLFSDTIAAAPYFAIIVVEIALWRFVEMIIQINNGLARYSTAATTIMIASAFRAAAAAAFMASGGGDVERWAWLYLISNGAAASVVALLNHPRVRPRWRPTVALARWRASLFYALSYFSFLAQNEADKLVVLSFAGPETAGLYAIAMRVIDLTAAPLRPAFVLMSRKLMRMATPAPTLAREIWRIEALVALASGFGLAAILALLCVAPHALGHNVAAAKALLAASFAAPISRNLFEFHGELFFGLDRLDVRGWLAGAFVVLKSLALALLLLLLPDGLHWAFAMNVAYAAFYAGSRLSVSIFLTPRIAR